MITDKLAKSAISAPLLTIDYTKIPSLYLLLQCDYLPIESSSHKAIKQLNESFHFHDFLQLICNSSLNILSTQWHIDWPLTLHFLNNNSISANKSSTSFPQYWYCTFKYKNNSIDVGLTYTTLSNVCYMIVLKKSKNIYDSVLYIIKHGLLSY